MAVSVNREDFRMLITYKGQELTKEEKDFIGWYIVFLPQVWVVITMGTFIVAWWLANAYHYKWENIGIFYFFYCLCSLSGYGATHDNLDNYRAGLIKQQKIATEPKPSRHYTRRLKGESDEEYLIRILEKQAQYGGADAIYKRLKYYYEMYELDRKKRTPKGLRCRKERKDV